MIATRVNGEEVRLQGGVVIFDGNGQPVSSFGTAGGATAAKQDTQITAEQAILATAGAPSGAAVVTDANGTLQQYLRGLVKMAAAGTINVRVKNGASFDIPPFDYQAFTYVGSTNNIATQVFKSGGPGGTTVATLTFAYVAAGAADDDLISSITQS
jgi:hypothetical protein